MAGANITAFEVRQSLDYDPLSGTFRWKRAISSAIRAGDIAGCLHHRGYWQIRFKKTSCLAHRLAWLHYYGHHPTQLIDHINGNKSDNRIANLRCVTSSENLQNQKRATSRNKSTGVLGVYFEEGRYRSRITVAGKIVSLGCFATAEDAYAAYILAKRRYHPAGTL